MTEASSARKANTLKNQPRTSSFVSYLETIIMLVIPNPINPYP